MSVLLQVTPDKVSYSLGTEIDFPANAARATVNKHELQKTRWKNFLKPLNTSASNTNANY